MESNRRKFMKKVLGGAAGLGTVSMLSSFRPGPTEPQVSPPRGAEPQVDIENLRITDINYVRMKFPRITPRKWNSTIISGGGPATNDENAFTVVGVHRDNGSRPGGRPPSLRIKES
jgi:hypothetical protein